MHIPERRARPIHESPSITTAGREFHPYLRDAVIACVPRMTDDQLQLIEGEVLRTSRHVRSSRLTDCAVLMRDIAIMADSPLDADRTTWDRMNIGVRAALCRANDATHGLRPSM
jgi:hypothetical protein